MGLAVNEGKTKYMLSTSKGEWCIDSQITADNCSFDTVKEFIYLGSDDTTKNDVSLVSNVGSFLPIGAIMVSMGN